MYWRVLRQLYSTFSPIVGLLIARRKENGRQSANYYWYLMGLVFRLTLFKHLYLSFLVALNTTREPQPTRTPCDSRGAECGVESHIPDDLKSRVFVLGVLSEPENLKRESKKTFEEIGEALAKDCSDNNNELWRHNLLKHNKPQLDRMATCVKPFLFK